MSESASHNIKATGVSDSGPWQWRFYPKSVLYGSFHPETATISRTFYPAAADRRHCRHRGRSAHSGSAHSPHHRDIKLWPSHNPTRHRNTPSTVSTSWQFQDTSRIISTMIQGLKYSRSTGLHIFVLFKAMPVKNPKMIPPVFVTSYGFFLTRNSQDPRHLNCNHCKKTYVFKASLMQPRNRMKGSKILDCILRLI